MSNQNIFFSKEILMLQLFKEKGLENNLIYLVLWKLKMSFKYFWDNYPIESL